MTTSAEARLGWMMPDFMQDLPLDPVDEDDLIDKVCDLSRTLLENRSDDEQAQFSVILFQLVAELVEVANAVYAGLAFLDMDGRPSMATVLVSRVAHESPDEESACDAVEATLKTAYPDDDIRTVQLPRVPAVTRIAAAPILMSAEVSPDGSTHVVPRNIIQAYVPIPHGTDFLVFELSTTCLEDWDLYSELFAEILKTIDWTTDEEIAEYRRLASISTAPQEPSVSEESAAALHWQSSRVMDTLQARDHVVEGGEQISATVCEECWSKGLRSACLARHEWSLAGLSPEAMETALDRVSSAGVPVEQNETVGPVRRVSWSVRDEAGAEFEVRVTAQETQSRISVEVSSSCSRRSDTRLLSDFG